jgi:hypothetical protein
MIINPIFYGGFHFSNGLANVATKEGDKLKWGYINTDGKLVIPHQFDYPGNFVNGLAHIKIDNLFSGEEMYINEKGEVVWKN